MWEYQSRDKLLLFICLEIGESLVDDELSFFEIEIEVTDLKHDDPK